MGRCRAAHRVTMWRMKGWGVPVAAVTSDHTLGDLKHTFNPSNSGGEKSVSRGQIKVAAGPRSPQQLWGESVPCPLQLLVATTIPWLVASSLQSLFHLHIASSSVSVRSPPACHQDPRDGIWNPDNQNNLSNPGSSLTSPNSHICKFQRLHLWTSYLQGAFSSLPRSHLANRAALTPHPAPGLSRPLQGREPFVRNILQVSGRQTSGQHKFSQRCEPFSELWEQKLHGRMRDEGESHAGREVDLI